LCMIARALWLSHRIRIGAAVPVRSLIRRDSHTASFAAVAAGMYSDSVVECATEGWRLFV